MNVRFICFFILNWSIYEKYSLILFQKCYICNPQDNFLNIWLLFQNEFMFTVLLQIKSFWCVIKSWFSLITKFRRLGYDTGVSNNYILIFLFRTWYFNFVSVTKKSSDDFLKPQKSDRIWKLNRVQMLFCRNGFVTSDTFEVCRANKDKQIHLPRTFFASILPNVFNT